MRPYVDGLPACHEAFPEASPLWLRAVAALAGRPVARMRRALHLDCGSGVGAAIAAAADPETEVWAAPRAGEDADLTRALADEAGIPLRRLDGGEEGVPEADGLPVLDLIALPSGWDAMTEAARARVLELGASRLSPGGILLLGRSVPPGAMVEDCLRRLIRNGWAAAQGAGDDADRAREALHRARRAFGASHGLRRVLPGLEEAFERAAALPPDLLRRLWVAPSAPHLSAVELGALLDRAGFDGWLCADPTRLVEDLDYTEEQLRLAAETSGAWMREELRDMMAFRHRRMDAFLRPGGEPVDPGEVVFAPTGPVEAMEYLARGLLGDCALSRSAYAPLMEALADGPRSLAQLQSALAGVDAAALNRRIAALFGALLIRPVAEPASEAACARLAGVLDAQDSGPWRPSARHRGPVASVIH